MNRSLLSDLRLKRLQQNQLRFKATNRSLISNTKRIFIVLFILLAILVLLFFRTTDEIVHDIGDINTLLEPILFIILFILFLKYFINRK
jgi:ACR3 family arsenite efflux pump ArsB